MKKAIALMICTLIAATAVACKDDTTTIPSAGEASKKGTDAQVSITDTVKNDQNDVSHDSIDVPIEDDTDAPTDEPDDIEKADPILPSMENVVLIDNNDLNITLVSTKSEEGHSPTLKLLLENKRSDIDMNFSIENSYINGYSADLFLYTDVLAEKKANKDVPIIFGNFEKYGLRKITKLELEFAVTDKNAELGTKPFFTGTAVIIPEQADAVFDVSAEYIDLVLVDDQYATVNLLDTYTDEVFGLCIDLEITNKSDKVLHIVSSGSSVGGKMLDPLLFLYLDPGRSVIKKVYWPSSVLLENGIENATQAELGIVISDPNDTTEAGTLSRSTAQITFSEQ